MTIQIDALGKACPAPVLLAKKALDGGADDLVILVDNDMAVQNLTRLAESRGLAAHAAPTEGGFAVRMGGGGAPAADFPGPAPARADGDCTFLIAKDAIGDGDPALGKNLMKMFLYTLAQSEHTPRTLIFMNGGVRLPAGDEPQVIESLRELEAKGCEILVCGTCLNFFGIAEGLKAGAVSNMYDIAERLQSAAKTITL